MVQYKIMKIAVIVLPSIIADPSTELTRRERDEILEGFGYFEKHVNYVTVLSQDVIQVNILNNLESIIHEVHSEGFVFYEQFRNVRIDNQFSVAKRAFLTINSHTSSHYIEMIKKFGCIACFSTLAFESRIGKFRELLVVLFSSPQNMSTPSHNSFNC